MSCARVPPRWKRLIALAVYLYVRRGELEALEWSDVNLDRRYVHVHRSVDDKGEIKPTKTGDTRKIPIEPELRPVLERRTHEGERERGWLGHDLDAAARGDGEPASPLRRVRVRGRRRSAS